MGDRWLTLASGRCSRRRWHEWWNWNGSHWLRRPSEILRVGEILGGPAGYTAVIQRRGIPQAGTNYASGAPTYLFGSYYFRVYLLSDHSRTCQTTFIIVRTRWTVPIAVIQAVLTWAGCGFLLALTAGLIPRVVLGTTRHRCPGYASPSLFRGVCVRYILCGSPMFCIRHRQVLSGERRIPAFGSPHQGHDQWERPVSKI